MLKQFGYDDQLYISQNKEKKNNEGYQKCMAVQIIFSYFVKI